MTNDAKQHNIAVVRQLLRDAFMPSDLRRFCQDRRLFSPVLDRFGPKFASEDMIDVVIEYCEKMDLLTDLLLAIREYNPRQYERYRNELYHEPHLVSTPSPGLLPGVPYQPPRTLDSFVGRAEEIQRLTRSLEPGAKMAIVGVDGLGKTELTKAVAYNVAGRFRDGVLWADCGYQEPSTIADLWAAEYKVQLPGSDLLTKATAWRSLVSEKEALLIFDNVQPGQDIEKLFPLRGRGAVILTTHQARHPAIRGAGWHRLGLFSQHEAMELAYRVLGSRLARDQTEWLFDLFHLLDGLPLAVAITLHLIREDNGALHDLIHKLREESGDSLHRALEIVWDALPRVLQEMLRTLALFSEGPSFSSQALAETMNLTETDAQMRLHSLSQRSLLIELGEGRWTLHSELRRFVEARHSVSIDQASHAQMAKHYLREARIASELYQRGGEELLQGLTRFSVEWPHIRAGQAWAAAHIDASQEAAQLCSDYVDAVIYYSGLRLSPQGWISWLEAGARAARQLGNKGAESTRLSSLGNIYADLGDIRQAIKYYTEAVLVQRIIGNRGAEADSLSSLGSAYLRLGDAGEAIVHHERALEIHHALGDRRSEAGGWGNLGVAHSILGDYSQAISCYRKGAAVYREIGDRLGEGDVLANLGSIYVRLQDPAQAISCYEQALAISQEVDDRFSEGNWLSGLGIAYANMGETEQAIEHYTEALTIHRELGDRRGEGADLINMGSMSASLRDIPRAIDYYRQALEIYQEIGDRRGEANALRMLGAAHSGLKEIRQANNYCNQALAIHREVGDRRGEGDALATLGDAYFTLGAVQEAVEHYSDALSIYREIGSRSDEGDMLSHLGRAFASLRELPRAIEYYEQALHIHRETNDLDGESADLAGLGSAYAALQENRRAVDYFESACKIHGEIGNRPAEEVDLANLGAAYGALGDMEQALSYYTRALDISCELGAQDREVQYLLVLGEVYQAQEETQTAVDHYERAVALSRELHERTAEERGLQRLALLHRSIGNTDSALHHYQELLAIYRDDQELDKTAETLVSMGNLVLDDGQLDRAEQFWTESRDSYLRLGSPLVTSVEALLNELETLRSAPITLEETARRFFEAAGFKLSPGDESVTFLCHPQHKKWQRRFSTTVPVRVFSGSELDAESVRTLCHSLSGSSDESSVIFVVIDQAPTDDGWLQIATLRAEGMCIVPIDDAVLLEGQEKQRQLLMLAGHLSRFLGSEQDLYNVRHPVADRLNFFGREVLAGELTEHLSEGHPLALFGLRKMGKSSMLKYMRDKLPNPTAIVDLEAGIDLQHLYERILTSWAHSVRVKVKGGNWSPPNLADATDVSSAFAAATRQLLDFLKDQGLAPRVCLLVDEMEVMFPHGGESAERYLAFTRTLRGLVQEQDGGFSLLVSSLDPSFNRINRLAGQQNPFYQFFREVYLPALEFDDCMRMICVIGRQMGLEYTEDSSRFVAEISGGHPFLARQLCSLAFQALGRDGDVPLSHLETIAERFIREPGKAELLDEAGLWGEISDLDLWPEPQAMANQAILLSLSQIEPQPEPELVARTLDQRACERSLDEMEKRDILGKPEATFFHIQLRLFRDWIRRYKLMGSA